MKKVLLTGAAGFIGSKTAEVLLNEGVEVVGIDNLNSQYDIRLKNFRLQELTKFTNFTFFKLDIENLEGIQDLFSKHKFDAVLNLAARAGVRYSTENPHVYLQTNSAGTLNLLDEMRKRDISKFVLASTSSLYAGQAMPFDENLAVNTPISPYAATKKAAEVMAYTYHYLYSMDVTILRYFTVYGPYGRPDMSIFRFIRWISEGKPIELFGDGTQSRDFTFVDDIAEGTVLGCKKKLGYEIINLGGGNSPVSLLTVIKMLEDIIGKKAQFQYSEFNNTDVKATWANIEKAERLLNWKPQTTLFDGLVKTVEAYKQNPLLKDVSLPQS